MFHAGAVRQHAARFLLAPLVALVAYLVFPRAGSLPPQPLAVGSVAGTEIVAPIGFLVPKPEPRRAREAEDLAATVRPLVTAHPEAADSAVAAAGRFFAVLDSAAAAGGSLEDAARKDGFALRGGDGAALAGAGQRSDLRRAVLAALRLSAAGYLAAGVSSAELGREVVVRQGSDERVVPSDSLRSFGDFLELAGERRPRERSTSGDRLYVRLLGSFFRPTMVYERGETKRRRDALRRSVDSVQAVVQPGEKIIGAHEVVDELAAAKLAAYRAAMERGTTGRVRGAVVTLGVLGLDA